MNKVVEKWDEILQIVKTEHDLSDVSFNTWLKPLTVYEVVDNVVTIIVPSEQVGLNYISKKYKLPLQVTISEVTGMENCDINFILPEDVPKKEEVSPKAQSQDARCEEAHLNPKYTFDTFVVGSNNKFAQAAALAVAESPGDAYNPLFIYGGAGLGKTHLMHSIAHFTLQNNPKKKVLYVTSDEFINDFIGINKRDHNGTNFNHVDFFKNKYRNIDVLIIDDIQFLGGATQTQQEFFHTFNTLYSDSKQIIISSDRSPDDLKLLEDRLRTRFCWGLTVNIFPPDFNLRVEIIKRKIIAGNFEKEISEDVIEYIASNMGSDVRQLEGSITRLVAYSAIMGGSEINLELAIEALKDFISKGISEKNDVHRIQKVVAEYFQISVEDIRSKKRSSNIAFPRQIAMYLCRKLTSESFPKIGTEFGGKDHSTVMHSVEKIENEIKGLSAPIATNVDQVAFIKSASEFLLMHKINSGEFVDYKELATLDEESLNQALNALWQLADSNRLIGIISHVGELKNRIENQIIVKKKRTGGSEAVIITG